jgi:SAM-dependent methyltransferase
MRALAAAGYVVDGVDSSAGIIALAREQGGLDRSRFFVSGGADCGEAPDGVYDLTTVFHAFHRVQPRAIRQRLLAAIARALRPGGVLYLQVPFFPDRTPSVVPAPHVPWASEADEAAEGADGGEVWTTPADLPHVLDDLGRHFRDVRLQVIDFPEATPRFGVEAGERLAHLVVSAATAPTLARRLYDVQGRTEPN